MANIVIIGAGLTGISTAYHLEQQGFHDYILFEKESTPGGLCGSIYQDGFTFDYTGHLLHVSDPYLHQLIEHVIGFEHFTMIERRSFIYSHDVYTPYPFQINLHGLPTEVIIECIEGFVQRKKSAKEPKNFYNWVRAHFGDGIARHFFIPFQSKILDYDMKKITSSWTGRFVPKTSLRDMLKGSLEPATPTVGYNAHFYYPKKGGIFFWVNKLAQHLKNPIRTGHTVEKIDVKNKIVFFTNGNFERYTHLVNTMPLDHLLDALIESPHQHLKKAIPSLKCNSVTNFNLGIKDRIISDKHWIYYPESHYPFYRIGFPHNFSEYATPPFCSSLYGEFSTTNRSALYKKEKLQESLTAVKRLFNIHEHEIATEKIIEIPRAYVIYDQWRERNLPKILNTLHNMHIASIGRYGAWKYASMQEAVLDGKEQAQLLLTQRTEAPYQTKATREYAQGK